MTYEWKTRRNLDGEHDLTTIEAVYKDSDGDVLNVVGALESVRKVLDLDTLVAYRVIKEYREPREFWINVYENGSHNLHATRDKAFSLFNENKNGETIHVREVLA